jgi:uncharacterized protein (DUF2164 family)
MAIELSPENTRQSVASIRRYFKEELDSDIGDLKAQLLLEFFLKEIGPSVFNRAIADAQTYIRDRVADLDGITAPEFGYWPQSKTRRA